MDRATFSRVLAWSPADEEVDRHSDLAHDRKRRPAPWPVVMTIQRLAFQRGEAAAYDAASALTEHRAAA